MLHVEIDLDLHHVEYDSMDLLMLAMNDLMNLFYVKIHKEEQHGIGNEALRGIH